MRTPPPVLPPPKPEEDDEPSFLERHAKAAKLLMFGAMGLLLLPLLLSIPKKGDEHLSAGALGGLVIALPVLIYMVRRGSVRFSSGAGAAMLATVQPSGNSTPSEDQYSDLETLVAKGQVASALEGYELVIAGSPGMTAPRMKAAEHYARNKRNPTRAAELFREIRSIPGASTRDRLYASSRLVDLYDGPLDDPGKALVELRRIVDQYPDSTIAKHSIMAIPALKERVAERVRAGQ